MRSAALLAALGDPARYPHPVSGVKLVETHISWVLLTGDYAYKIKKPVNLGFLDFTTLALRRHFCEEELRLNRRLAPGLYLGVVPITGTACRPAIAGDGPALEYAVKMKEFPQSALLENALARGDVSTAQMEELARHMAGFHARLVPQETVPGGDALASIWTPARDNFAQMLPLLDAPADIAALTAIRNWTLHEFDRHAAEFRHRHAAGCTRECHGDLHLGNIVLLDGAATPFDCLEFDPALRWMDVMSEVAFLAMDLQAHGRRDLAFAFLSTYLETSGDYEGVRLLPYYSVYRAVVRAKVSLIQATRPDTPPAARGRAMDACRRYIAHAAAQTRGGRGAVVITHGLSGSGKTRLTRQLLGGMGAVRVRSDVERKRLHGLPALAKTGAAAGAGIYTDGPTALTYDSLLRQARCVAGAGIPVIVDATFLRRAQRAAFHALAVELGVPFAIVNVTATPATLRARVAARAARGDDASEATLDVLEAQIGHCEALMPGEMRHAVLATGAGAKEAGAVRAQLGKLWRRPLEDSA